MTKRKFEHQPRLKLYYFDVKGKGEAIRLFCAYSGLELEDYRFASRDEFTAMKESGELPFGQVPLLEVQKNDDEEETKHHLVQMASILRYLSKLASLEEQDPLVAAKVDAALDQEADTFMGPTIAIYSTRHGFTFNDEQKEKVFNSISTEVLPRHLGNIEKILKASTTGWIANTKDPSIADFVWYVRLNDSLPGMKDLSDKIKSLEDYPACKTFVEKFKELETIKKYYAPADPAPAKTEK